MSSFGVGEWMSPLDRQWSNISPGHCCWGISKLEVQQEFWISWPLWMTTSGSPLQWRHNERDGVSNHRRLDCLLNRLYSSRSKKISKLRVTGLCEGGSPVSGEFPAQRASSAVNVSIWWRHHAKVIGNSWNPEKHGWKYLKLYHQHYAC